MRGFPPSSLGIRPPKCRPTRKASEKGRLGLVGRDGLGRLLGVDFGNGEAATLGGYLAAQLGHLPQTGERVTVGSWHIIVERATDHRVVSARFERHSEG
ncbi:MAG TPA: transporter associated domain-containing protein [Candidatus Limnocylindrales bacterium]